MPTSLLALVLVASHGAPATTTPATPVGQAVLVAGQGLALKIAEDRAVRRSFGVRDRGVAVDQLAVLRAADVGRRGLVEDAEQAREHERQRGQRGLHTRLARPGRGATALCGAASDGGEQGPP